MTQSTVSIIFTRNKPVTTLAVLERIADGLAMPDEPRMRLGLAPKEVDGVRRRTALGIGLVSTLTPAALTSVLRESAAQALEFTRERAVTAVGTGTLDHLTAVIADLDKAYPWRPAAELLPLAWAYRQRVEGLLNGKRTLAEARELYVHAAYLSLCLSDLAGDLHAALTAQAFAIDCQELAEQAGHGELFAWAAKSKAFLLLQSGAASAATTAALSGLDLSPRQHPLAALLRVVAARGYARQGNRTACVDLLTEARQVCEQLPDQMPSRLATASAEHTHYRVASQAGSCLVSLGEWKDGERQARTACGEAQWFPGMAACTQLDLGLALAHLDSPDEAAERGKQALALGRGFADLLAKARTLDATLQSRYPKEPATGEFRARYQQWNEQSLLS